MDQETTFYTSTGKSLVESRNITQIDAEYYANKNCKWCWGKGTINVSFPHVFDIIKICHCSEKRMQKEGRLAKYAT